MIAPPEKQISSLLIANRGEIARRVTRTCRTLGIATVAVFSDADADSPHVAESDVAVRLPGNAPAETYLRADALIDAAARAGADAVHPGYGFLSENAEFAGVVERAGLNWIGPSPDAIASMASKTTAKQIMGRAGVPLLPELAIDTVTEQDLPVLVKASAGGGGRGMRVVRDRTELAERVESARHEAASAFGDATVFCEPYLESGRHIEVQVLADEHGAVWAVGERECSIQRRHQKVVEEAPAPLVDDSMRHRLFDAARQAAIAIGYVGAGTVEFLATADGRFYFLEMNTRLQVEHPVTECVTGLDLVASQLRIAEGHPLPDEQVRTRGHAIEARLYAEDPANEWQPQSGPLHRFESSTVDAEFTVPAGHGIRMDSGVRGGSVVSPHYDPMLAKIVSWAPTRAEAARSLAHTLAGMRVHGPRTNRDLLVRVLRNAAFLDGDTDTAFFDRQGLANLAVPLADETVEKLSALAAALASAARNRRAAPVQSGIPSGWRNVVSGPQHKRFSGVSRDHDVAYRLGRSGLEIEGDEEVSLVTAEPERVVLDVGPVRQTFVVARYGNRVAVDSALGAVELTRCERFPDPAEQVEPGSMLAPMPGSIARIAVSAGDKVSSGQPLLWMEAMKMEHQVVAPIDGVVNELPAVVGQQVDTGTVLAVVHAAESAEDVDG